MSEKRIVGVDVGGTNIRVGVVNEHRQLLEERMFDARLIEGEAASQNLLEYLSEYIQGLLFSVDAISIGFPSTLDRERTTVISTPNLAGFENVAIKAMYEKALGIPVILDKDACMLLCYDLHMNHTQNRGVVVGIYFGTGIGNSIMVDGRPVVGLDGAAGELGHIPVFGKEDPCSCGLQGCLELYAAGKGLERICSESFPETPLSEVFLRHGNALELESFVRNIAMAVVTEINILNPDCIVLGGGVLAMKGFPKEELRAHINAMTRKPIPADTLHVVFSTMDHPFGGVIGAGLRAMVELNGGGDRDDCAGQ